MGRSKDTVNARTKRIALLGILGAQALVLSFLESLLSPLPGLPPGAKPGLSNIVTMFTAATMGLGDALLITLFKAVFAGLTRGFTAFLMSLAGGVLSTLVMVAFLKWQKNPFGILGVSIMAAVAHNAGQLLVACFISGTPALLLGYGPLLLLFGILAGAVTGIILKFVFPALEKQSAFFGL